MPDTTVEKLGVIDGLKNIYYALETKDDSSGATYGTPVKLGNARNADITKETETFKYYGDNRVVHTRNRLKSAEITIESTDIPLAERAKLLGHSIDASGKMTITSEDNPPYVALMFEATKLTGGSVFYKFYTGKFGETDESFATQEEDLSPTSPNLTGTFIAREFDGAIYSVADSANSISATVTSEWFDAV